MRLNGLPRRLSTLSAMCLGSVFVLTAAHAQQQATDQIVEEGVERTSDAAASQRRINQTQAQTDDLLAEYKTEMKVVDGLIVYNTLLQRQLDNQQREIATLNKSIDQVDIIQRQIVPLMMRMLDGLTQFVELDWPFLMDERRKRVERLTGLMDDPDIAPAEKFRAVMEAFEIEMEYGRTISDYKGSLDVQGKTREVDFLQVGRVALVYQSVGGEYNGAWDQNQRRWVDLSAEEYRNHINRGLRIARDQIPPELLMMPVLPAGGAQ